MALNESGWWEQALERLTLACAYTLEECTRAELCQMVNESSGLQPNSNRLLSTIDKLLNSGSLVALATRIRVAEEIRVEFASHEATTLASEEATKSWFEELAREHGLGDRAQELWIVFEEDVVLPLIEHLGARTYGFLHSSSVEDTVTIVSRIEDLVKRHGDDVRVFLGTFINPQDDNIRSFILRRLNAQYALNAGGLPSDELDHLAQLTAKPSRINVFLDTNFLLSVLGLSDNPSNEVALDLLELVDQLKGRVNLRLYVLPITIEETRRVVRHVALSLKNFAGQTNLARAGSKATSRDLVKRYFDQAQRSSALTPEAFFEPYDSGLVPLLRNKCVELFNADLTALRMDQEVINDIHDQEEYQNQYRKRGPKPYDSNLHDMVLWHFTDRHRSRATPAELPLEIPSWIVTIDYGFISFDKYKQRSQNLRMPICLDPTSLIHLFQFWVPSSMKLDEALVGSLRQPLLFLDFDIRSEQVTLRILGQLSHYVNAENLHPDVVAEILANTALRDRIENAPSDRAADASIVREHLPQLLNELGEEVAALRRQLYNTERKERNLRDQRDAAVSERSRRQAVEAELKVAQKERCRAEEKAQQAAENEAHLEKRIALLEEANEENVQRLKQRGKRDARRLENRRLTIRALLTLMATALVGWGGNIVRREWLPDRPGYALAVAFALAVLLLGAKVTVRGTRFQDARLFRWWVSSKKGKGWKTILILVVVEVTAGFIFWALGVPLP